MQLNPGTTPNTFPAEVWYSSDAINWQLRTGRAFTPGRYFHGCDVDLKGRVVVVGGLGGEDDTTATLLNDVWASTNKGVTWTLTTARAPFAARWEAATAFVHSDRYNVDLLYVIGGVALIAGEPITANDGQ